MDTPRDDDDKLFDRVARQRPEWLAQGVLRHALLSDEKVLRRVADRLGRTSIELASDLDDAVTEEEVTAKNGWRADLVIHWKSEPVESRLELKIAAKFTQRQDEAAERDQIDAAIVPSRREAYFRSNYKGEMKVITFRDLADHATDGTLAKILLGQADAARGWRRDRIDKATVTSDLRNVSGDSSGWRASYCFLATVDELLNELLPKKYESNDGWSWSKKPGEAYYGFKFHIGERRSWDSLGAPVRSSSASRQASLLTRTT